MKLYKTEIIIWSRYDGNEVELSDLAREATDGDAYCSRQRSTLVAVDTDPDYDGCGGFFDELMMLDGDNGPQNEQ